MLKTALIAASLVVLGASGAVAQEQMQSQHYGNSYGYASGPESPEAFGGINQYCGPGQVPHVWPFGDGVRCELPNGGYSYF